MSIDDLLALAAEGEPLPPFSLEARCPKCWSEDICTIWVPQRALRAGGRHASRGRLSSHEHMERNCRNCQYEWAELPMDKLAELQQLGAVGTEDKDKGKPG